MNNKLIKDSSFILLAKGISFLTTIIITKIISVNYSLTDYGLRSQILTIATVMTSFLSLGLSNAANYFVPLADDDTSRKRVVRNIYLIVAGLCVMAVTIEMLLGGYIASFLNAPSLSVYKILISVLICEQIVYSIYAGVQISQKNALRSTVTELVRLLITVIVVIAVCYFRGSIFIVIIGTICVDAIFCIYTVVDATGIRNGIRGVVNKSLMWDILKYCIPLGVSAITGTLCAQIDKLFVSKLLSLKDLAIYTNMCTELPLAAISGSFIAVITPYVVKMLNNNNQEKAVRLWGHFTELTAILLFPIIALLFVFSKQAIVILYSSDYVEGYQLFRIFILLEISRITYYGLILRSYGKTVIVLLSSLITLVSNIILNVMFYFVFNMGMYGFALSTFISTFIAVFLLLGISSKLTKISFSRIFPWKRLGKCAVINIVPAIVFIIVTDTLGVYESINLWEMLLICVIWVIVYFAIMFRRMKIIYGLTNNLEEL